MWYLVSVTYFNRSHDWVITTLCDNVRRLRYVPVTHCCVLAIGPYMLFFGEDEWGGGGRTPAAGHATGSPHLTVTNDAVGIFS